MFHHLLGSFRLRKHEEPTKCVENIKVIKHIYTFYINNLYAQNVKRSFILTI